MLLAVPPLDNNDNDDNNDDENGNSHTQTNVHGNILLVLMGF